MKITKAALAASIAATMLLVVEAVTNNGSHHASYIIEQSPMQYYDAVKAKKHPHFQILKTQQKAYQNMLDGMGFDKVVFNPITCDREGGLSNGKFYTILTKDNDYHLDDVHVVNCIANDAELQDIVSKIPMEDIAQRMFVDDYNKLSKSDDKRNNLRYDSGYTGQNQTDTSVVVGMNFPHRLITTSSNKGIGRDKSLEHTLFKAGINVMKLADKIHERESDNHDDNDEGESTTIWGNRKRDAKFGGRWANAMGQSRLSRWARFDAVSCFGTGETSDFSVRKTDKHTDDQNAGDEGEDHTPTFTAIVPVTFANGFVVHVRVGVNLYKKSCCSDAWKRLCVNNDIHDIFVRNEPARKGRTSRNMHLKFMRPPNMRASLRSWTRDADDDKDGHLSLYVNAINSLGDICERDRAALLEALYTIPMTPSAAGWRAAFEKIIRDYLQCKGNLKEGIVRNYINNMLHEHDSVSSGTDPRCMSSQQGQITQRQITQSLQNMDKCFKWADKCDDTKRIIKRMSNSVKNGGIHGVGPFYAHILINLATKLGLISNHIHIDHVSVSPSTTTFKRLKYTFGVNTTAHAAEIIPFLVYRTKKSAMECENRLCEVLRLFHGTEGIVDVFFDGDILYKLSDGCVWTIDTSGVEREMDYVESNFGVHYEPSHCWWDGFVKFGRKEHAWDRIKIQLTRKRRRLCDGEDDGEDDSL